MTNRLHLDFVRRIVVTCRIRTAEELHVGAERESVRFSEADSPFQRAASNEPFIPGSSVRGVLRSHMSRLLCSIEDSDDESLEGLLMGKRAMADRETIKSFAKEKNEEHFNALGIIDMLFGVSGFASPLRVTDAKCVTTNPPIQNRTHVSIELGTDKAKRGALTTLETVGEKTEFEFKLVFDESADDRLRVANMWFYRFMHSVSRTGGINLFFGGWKSRGYGYSHLRIESIQEYSVRQLILGEPPTEYTDAGIIEMLESRMTEGSN